MREFFLAVSVVAAGSTGGCGGYAERNSESGPDATSSSSSSSGSGIDGSGAGGSGTGPSSNTTSGSAGGNAGTTETATTGFITDLSCDIPSTPCGGDVVGTWAAVDCPLELDGPVDMTGLGLGCAHGEVTSGYLVVSGSLTLDGMGNFEDDTSTRGELVFELPETCLQTNVAFCNDIARPLHATGFASATCSDNLETGGCTCSGTFDQQGGLGVISHLESVRGSYTASEGSLTTDDSYYEATYDYCVMDNALVLTVPTRTRAGDVGGSIVLQKQ